VPSRTPAARATSRIPPWPSARASAPINSRRCRSSRCGNSTWNFAANDASTSSATPIPASYHTDGLQNRNRRFIYLRILTTNNAGSGLTGPVTYDPWGQPTPGSQSFNNAAGGNVLGAFGAHSKLTDTALGITILGARAYQPAEGRFLSVDPIEGGCANNYVYVFGDPLNSNDLTGQKGCTITIARGNNGSVY
jgi:RHS repeat-associated protein